MTNKSFSDLRKQSTNIEQIAKVLKDSQGKKNYDDSRFWKAALDKAGNGSADIRFLPAPYGEENTFVQYYDHFFQGPGGYFVDNCPTTLGLPCPVCEDNGRHWKEGTDGEAFVRNRKSKRGLHYVTNVLVVKDPANPENEGKVFLFKYGAKIQEKYMNAIIPKFEGDVGYLPYHLNDGANFKLRICKIKGNDGKGYANFDQSMFAPVSPLKGTDEQLEAIWKSEHSLKEFVDPSKFKDYNALAAKLGKVLSETGGSSAKTIEETLDQVMAPAPSKTVSAPKQQKAPVVVAPSTDSDEIDDLKSLLADD